MSSFDPAAWFSDETGRLVVEHILTLAGWLTREGTPGWVSLVLVVVLVVLCLWYGTVTWRFVRAVRSARENLRGGPTGKITRDRLIDIDRAFASSRNPGLFHRRLGKAWLEFKETTLQPATDSEVLRNTVRPAAFFNREDLGLEAGTWRQVPAFFVSVGLFLTFLGLVAALEQTGSVLDGASPDAGATVEGLKTLLQVASAKFIMSLTGLFCSIVFSVALRVSAKHKDGALHALCSDVEDGCDFLSEQDVLRQLLNQAEEQTTHLQTFSTELVAQIARPLKEDLPNAIRESLSEAMKPVIDNISQSTNRGIKSLVGSVSGQLVDGVQESVVSMTGAIEGVRDALEAVTSRLDRSSGAMSENVDKAVEALSSQIDSLRTSMSTSSETATKTLADGAGALLQRMDEAARSMRDTSAEGAQRIGTASNAMAEAAEALSRTVHDTTKASAEASGRELERAGREMATGISVATQEMRETVLDPMNELGAKVDRLASGVEAATGSLGGYAQSVEQGTRAVASANDVLGQTVGAIAEATEPVRTAVFGIEAATRTMGNRVEAASEAMNRTTMHTESVMRGAREAIESSHASVRDGLGTLEHAVTEFREVIDAYRQIDENLGDAFQKIETAVRSSIAEIGAFQRNVNEEFGRALNQLEAVVAQAEPFTPREAE